MIKGQVEIEIDEEPEILFDLLADPSKAPTWNPNITEVNIYIEAPIAKGSKGRLVSKFGKRRVEYEDVYYEYDKPVFVSCGATNKSEVSRMS